MHTSKFFKSQRNSHDYQLSFDSNPLTFTTLELHPRMSREAHYWQEAIPEEYQNPLATTTLELYPRIRRTELYRQAAIPEEYQVRDFEHPRNLDYSSSISINNMKREKIIPPKNSEMRVLRDSYFS